MDDGSGMGSLPWGQCQHGTCCSIFPFAELLRWGQQHGTVELWRQAYDLRVGRGT